MRPIFFSDSYPYVGVTGLTQCDRPVLDGKPTVATTIRFSDILVSLSKIPKPLSFHIRRKAEFRFCQRNVLRPATVHAFFGKSICERGAFTFLAPDRKHLYHQLSASFLACCVARGPSFLSTNEFVFLSR